ncbi:hypothetical protein KUH03_29395 [Sphingobacterium sp. E70]|uniref:hypothetical protein n=1 Tax=Sphingobacterium sp. E70 TaxID=2853439 RepID=UPI00211CF1DA|nr:hypothetical protein [Sphingobacterium sp. E70]ULT23293.1 hypothetical protein KUH03_29395 [Sphingobacterium sp. E70]
MKKLKIARPLIPNNKFILTIATIVIIAIALTGCTKKQAEELSPEPSGPEEVTVKMYPIQILQKHFLKPNAGHAIPPDDLPVHAGNLTDITLSKIILQELTTSYS